MEALVAIIDRVISLIERRKESRERLFRDHIEPIFLDLSMVHTDYVAGFDEICAVFWDHRIAIWEIAPRVDALRRQLDHLRTKVTALAVALHTAAKSDGAVPEEVRKFADAVLSYFQVGAGHGSTLHPAHGSTYYTTLLDLIALAEGQRVSRNECEKWAETFFDTVRSRWSDVTVAYANAKVKCLK